MFSRMRERIGTAGLVVAIIALVAAMGGGAYAASNALTGKQKKEVEKIAKKFAGEDGKPGAQGAQGPAGPVGAAGKNGAAGQAGAPGAAGDKGATGTTGPAGEEGSPWTAGGVLPEGVTATGTWGGPVINSGFIPVSLPLPTEEPLEARLVTPDGKEFDEEAVEQADDLCSGIVDGVPTADEGALCIYASIWLGPPNLVGLFNPSELADPNPHIGVSVNGALVGAEFAGETFVAGVWAATAPEA